VAARSSAAARQPARGVHDRGVPAEQALPAHRLEPQQFGHHGRCEWTADRRAQVRAAARRDLLDQALRLRAHEVAEALPHRIAPERPRERAAMALVLVAVAREHAAAEHLAGAEARIVDRQRLRVAHRPQRQVPARDEPAAERRQPGHRLALPQAREQRMRIVLELLERRRRAERELAHAAR
jgi:hypothetical protein